MMSTRALLTLSLLLAACGCGAPSKSNVEATPNRPIKIKLRLAQHMCAYAAGLCKFRRVRRMNRSTKGKGLIPGFTLLGVAALSTCSALDVTNPIQGTPGAAQIRTKGIMSYNPVTHQCYQTINTHFFNGTFSSPSQSVEYFDPSICQQSGIDISS